MSVLLINPRPWPPVPARLLTPPLGLAYLAAALKAAGIKTWLLDADALDLAPRQVLAFARNLKPAIIGLTAMTPTVAAAYELLEVLRPATDCLVLGGPHASAIGPEVFSDCPVPLEAAFGGEADESFPAFVRKVLAGGKVEQGEIPGLFLPGVSASPPWPIIQDLDRLPFPDRDDLPHRKYRHPLFPGHEITTIITSRGCPYHCLFCDKHVSGSRWRPRSPRNVIAELTDIVLKSRITRIIIYDDLFTLDRNRVIAICQAIIRTGLRLAWKCEGRVNRVDPEMLAWMKRAGCEMVAYGVETATEKGRDFLKKDFTLDQVHAAFAMTRAAGIKTLGYFLLGIPGETEEDELETIKLAIDIGADYAQFGVLSPLPGTELHRLALQKGWIKELPARGPAERGSRRPVILDGYWTIERLDRLLRTAHRRFYFRPRYLWQRLHDLRAPRELCAQAGQGIKLARWYLKKTTT